MKYRLNFVSRTIIRIRRWQSCRFCQVLFEFWRRFRFTARRRISCRYHRLKSQLLLSNVRNFNSFPKYLLCFVLIQNLNTYQFNCFRLKSICRSYLHLCWNLGGHRSPALRGCWPVGLVASWAPTWLWRYLLFFKKLILVIGSNPDQSMSLILKDII